MPAHSIAVQLVVAAILVGSHGWRAASKTIRGLEAQADTKRVTGSPRKAFLQGWLATLLLFSIRCGLDAQFDFTPPPARGVS